MSERVTMPALGESVTEGTVTRWLKQVGDEVAVDEPLLEVSTDKVDTEIPSPVAGTLQEILVQEDDTVPVGADLAVIGEGAAPAGDGASSGGASAGDSADEEDPSAREPDAPEPELPSTEQPMEEQTSEPEAERAAQPASNGAGPSSSGTGGGSGGGSGWWLRWRRRRGGRDGDHAGAGRVGHRGHRHALAQGRG